MLARKGFTLGEMLAPITRKKQYIDKKTGNIVPDEEAKKLIANGKKKEGEQVITTTTYLVSPIWILIALLSGTLCFAT
jgi:hypothetical protein